MNNICSVNSFLLESMEKLNGQRIVNIAIGNEAADLDSMVSSIMYSYYQYKLNKDDDLIFLPVVNIPRNDFKLRTEAVYLFNEIGLNINNLFFIDEIDFERLFNDRRLALTLIDHNILCESQKKFAVAVVGIIDHHKDEKLYDYADIRVIEPVGSAATLVAEKIMADIPELLDVETSKLLLGTILVDTVNLDPAAERVTDKDNYAAERLLIRSGADQNDLFIRLQNAKFNADGLATEDLLRKDYKEWQFGSVKCGVGSVLIPLTQWLNKDAKIVSNFNAYLQDRKLDVLISMNAYTDPDFKREFVIYSKDSLMKNKIIDYLPHGIEELILKCNFDLELNNLPNSIEKIVFKNNDYNKKLNCLPDSIEIIELPNQYDLKIDKLPKNLKKIK